MAVTGTSISLTLRQTKGSELTHKELDDNQSGLKTGIESHSHDEFAPSLTSDENYVTDAEKTALSTLSSTYEPKNANIQSHISSTSDPHNTQFDQLGGTLTKLPLNTGLATQTLSAGEMAWNPDERTFDMGVNGVTLQAGQEIVVNVRNNTGSTISNGTVCMATGTIGASGRITVAPMDGSNAANAMYLLGIATEDITAGADGFVTVFGKVRGVNTSAYSDGDVLYTSTNTPGALTKTAPTSGLKQPIAFVVNAASNGVIFVRIETLNHLAFQANGIIVTNGDGNSYLANDGTYKAVSGGGSETYTNITPVPTTIGGISSGSTFDSKTMTEMWTALLYPYQSPTFSSFSFGQSSPIEVGLTLTGSKTFTWATTNSSNISSNSISILDITGSATLASGLANDGSEVLNIGTVQKTTATSHTWRISAVNTNSVTFTRDVSIAWQWRRFYGESTTTPLIESEIEALRVSGLATGFSGTYSFVGGGYKYLCYPTSFGTATTFKDQSTNLDVPFEAPYTVNITNVNGIATDYRVHRSTNILGAAINIVVS